MTPTEILDLVLRTHPTKEVEEHAELVIVRARLDDAGLRAEWLALRADIPAFLSSVAIRRDGQVRFVVMGQCDWADARSRAWLDELLARRG